MSLRKTMLMLALGLLLLDHHEPHVHKFCENRRPKCNDRVCPNPIIL